LQPHTDWMPKCYQRLIPILPLDRASDTEKAEDGGKSGSTGTEAWDLGQSLSLELVLRIGWEGHRFSRADLASRNEDFSP